MFSHFLFQFFPHNNFLCYLDKFYAYDDKSAPILSQRFDGLQNDIVLTLLDNIEVKDLKWISIWCREFEVSFGDFVFTDHSDDENEYEVVKPPKKPHSSGTLNL